jgi:NAD(P)-dependent dehydrogenase (short-subunit alcohol dehydrogenase family)
VTTGAVTKLSKEEWDAVIGVNLSGATFMVREVVAKMVETNTGPGVIVNMSSHRAARQPRPVQLLRGQGRPRGQHAHLGPRVRRRSASAWAPWPPA